MNYRNSVLFGASLLALFATQSVSARPAGPDPAGPPITVQFSSTYYSNVANSSAALAAARGLKEADVVYNPAVLANIAEPLGGITFFLTGQAGYDIHQSNSILDRERIDLQAGADTQVDVCDATVSGGWGRHQSDLADLSIGTVKNTQETVTAGLDATCTRLGRFVPSASVKQTWADNSAIQYFGQDFHSLELNGSLAYVSEPIGTVSLIGEYTQTSFPHRLFATSVGVASDGYNLYAAGLHYERNIGATLQFGASIFETSLSSYNGIGKNFSGVTYDATLAYAPTPRLSFNLALTRKANPAYYLNAAYAIREDYSGEADYRITSRLSAKLGAADAHSKFVGAALIPGTDITHQTFWSYYGGLAFNVSPTFSVSLTAGEDQRHSDVVGYNYSGARVGLALSKAF